MKIYTDYKPQFFALFKRIREDIEKEINKSKEEVKSNIKHGQKVEEIINQVRSKIKDLINNFSDALKKEYTSLHSKIHKLIQQIKEMAIYFNQLQLEKNKKFINSFNQLLNSVKVSFNSNQKEFTFFESFYKIFRGIASFFRGIINIFKSQEEKVLKELENVREEIKDSLMFKERAFFIDFEDSKINFEYNFQSILGLAFTNLSNIEEKEWNESKKSYYKAKKFLLPNEDFELEEEKEEKEEKEENKEEKEENKWKIKNVKSDMTYPMHFILAYVDETYGYFLIGGTDNGNCFQFKDGKITPKANMSIQRSFMSVISYDQLIFAIGGYDFAEKNQTGSIEIYEVQTNEWKSNILKDLIVPRSQAGALLMNSTSIYVFGGYSKAFGTLNSIEHISIETKENKLIDLNLPIPLRRFGLFPISENKAILLGGISKNSQKIEGTYIVDLSEKKVKEGMNLSRGGVLEHEIIFEDNGKVHLFFENNYGTAPPEHLCVDFFNLWNV